MAKKLKCSSFVQAIENGQDGDGGELMEMKNLHDNGRDSSESEVVGFHFSCEQPIKSFSQMEEAFQVERVASCCC